MVNDPSTSRGIVRDCSRSVNHSVSGCTRRAVLVGASTAFLSRHAAADGIAVPIRLQAELLSKVASYDRNFEARTGERVRTLLLMKQGDPESGRAAVEMKSALSSIPTIGALPHEEELATYSDPAALAEMCKTRKISILYLAPGFSQQVDALRETIGTLSLLSVGSLAEYVPNGIVLGFDLVSGRSKLLVNLTQARRQQSRVSGRDSEADQGVRMTMPGAWSSRSPAHRHSAFAPYGRRPFDEQRRARHGRHRRRRAGAPRREHRHHRFEVAGNRHHRARRRRRASPPRSCAATASTRSTKPSTFSRSASRPAIRCATPTSDRAAWLMTGDRGNHFLLFVNGHAVNEPLYGSAQFGRGLGIPLELIDHLEVVIGPGSVLYGSSAMFGVINVITKRAKDFAGTHVIGETEVGKSYRAAAGAGYQLGATDGAHARARAITRRKVPPSPSVRRTSASTTSPARPSCGVTKGPADGIWQGKASNSYYSYVPGAVLRLSSGNLEVNLRATTYKRSAPYAAYLSPVPGDFDYPDNYDLDRSASADIAYRIRPTALLDVSARVYGDTYDTQKLYTSSTRSNCIYGDTSPCRYRFIGISQWVGTEVQTSFNWLKDSSFVTLVGADVRLVGVQAKQDIQNADTGAYRESSSNVIPRPATTSSRKSSAPICSKRGRPPLGSRSTPARASTRASATTR